MSQLVVRNIEPEIVEALKQRAAARISALKSSTDGCCAKRWDARASSP